MTRTTYTCKTCGHKVTAVRCILFNAAAVQFAQLRIILHAITCHWAHMPHEVRLKIPLWLVTCIFELILLVPVDLLHALLWAATFPFWWLHEEVL